jgi:hypothetical protein
MTRLFHSLAGVTALAAALSAVGQPAPVDRANAGQGAHTQRYRSAFADYAPYRDMPRADWRALNDAVRDADGHAAVPAPAASAALVAPAASAAAPGHGAHRNQPMHGGPR